MFRLPSAVRSVVLTLRTIRARLTLWYVLLLAIILVAFSGFLLLTLALDLQKVVDQSLTNEAQQVQGNLQDGNGQLSLGQNPDLLPPAYAVALYDPTGKHLIASDPGQPLPVLASALRRASKGHETFTTIQVPSGETWRALTIPVTRGTRQVGILQVARSQQDVVVAIDQLLRLILIAIPTTLLMASAGGLFLAARALGPIDRITRAAGQIGADDLSYRLQQSHNADEVGRLATTFDQMLDRLDRAFRRQRRFTADAAHELRTPLAMLTSQIDLSLDRPRSSAEYQAVLRSIREDASHLSQLVSELLTLARADSGDQNLVREAFALDVLVGDVVESMALLAASHDVHLDLAAQAPVNVLGDQTRLTQLLVNLVDNGLKYTPPGGRVTVSLNREDQQAVIRVADTGPGIEPEHLPHVFERFYRGDAARTRGDGGTGLGLAICRWIVQSHGGDIGVLSAPGQGTVFTVTLPILAEQTLPTNLVHRTVS